MSLATIIELAALLLGLFSALFFCIGILHLKPDRVEEIATRMWGKGVAIAEEMITQKSDFIAGAFLLVLSFFMQFIVKAIPEPFAQVAVQNATHGAVVSVAIATAITLCVRIANHHLRKVFLRQVQQRIQGKI